MKKTRKKQSEELLSTAFHEASHAVVACKLGLRITKVTIEPTEECLGAMIHDGRSKITGDFEFSMPSPSQIIKVENRILCSIAGVIGERRLVGVYKWRCAGADMKSVVRLAALLHDGKVLDLYLDYMFERCAVIVKLNWHIISHLAKQLVQRKTMTAAEVREEMNKAAMLQLARGKLKGIV